MQYKIFIAQNGHISDLPCLSAFVGTYPVYVRPFQFASGTACKARELSAQGNALRYIL